MNHHEGMPGSGDDHEHNGPSEPSINGDAHNEDSPSTPFGAQRMLNIGIVPLGDMSGTVADQLACYTGDAASGAVDDAGDAFGPDHQWPEEL